MKKMRVILAVVLVICVALGVCMCGSVFASAQAIPLGVSMDFTGLNDDNYFITLNDSNTIQDSNFKLMIYNNSEDAIVLSGIESNGTSVRYDGWTQNAVLDASGIASIGVSGTTNNKAVFTVTITYYKQGNPTATAETCTAYRYATNEPEYTKAESEGYIPFRVPDHAFGVVTTHTLEPVSTAALEYADENADDKLEARNTVTIYVDRGKYKKWDELNMKLSLFNYVEDYGWQFWKADLYRDHAYFDKLEISQNSQTGSMFLDGYGSDPEHPTVTSEFNYDQDNPEGYCLQAGQNVTATTVITGKVPEEETSVFTIKMRELGQTGGVFGTGLAPITTDEMHPQWSITVYNNDKTALKDTLMVHSNYGLNKASYKTGWDEYEAALKQAYTVFGKNQVTASDVSEAISNLTAAYNNMERYAVVYTNHYFYQGIDTSNPVLVSSSINMKVPNNAVYSPEVLTNGTFPEYAFNRKAVTSSKRIQVGDSTNYTDTVNQYYWYVDTSELSALVASQIGRTNFDEDNNEIYSSDSWQVFEAAVLAGQQALTNEDFFQADINAAVKAINDAEKALVKLDVDVEWLAEGMGWAEMIMDNDFDEDFGLDWDTNELLASPYAQELYMQMVSAYNEAVEVTSNPDFTKAQADRVCAALWQAINNLRMRDEVTKGLYNADNIHHADIDTYGHYQLLNKYSEPNGLRPVFNDILDNTSGTYRLNEADFTADSWYALKDALYGDYAPGNWTCASTEEAYPTYDGQGELSVPAYSMINNIWFLSTQAEYNACRDNLIDKVNHLEWIVDTTALEQALALAQAYDLDVYTHETGDVLQAVMDEAAAELDYAAQPQLYGDPNAITNEVVAHLVQELETAIAALQERPYFESNHQDISFEPGENTAVYGVQIGQTTEQVLACLNIIHKADNVIVNVYTAQNEPAALSDPVGTGYKIELCSTGGEVFESHTFVVLGDVNGDAAATTDDFALVYDYAFYEDSLEGVFLEAANLNGDDYTDLCDAVMLQQMYA